MGKGDKRTKKGKIVSGSFGNSRPKHSTLRKAKQEAMQEVKQEAAPKVEEA